MNGNAKVALIAGGVTAAVLGVVYAATRKAAPAAAASSRGASVAAVSPETFTSIRGMIASRTEAPSAVGSFAEWQAEQERQAALMKNFLSAQMQPLLSGEAVVVDEPTFRILYTHGLARVFRYVPGFLYDSNVNLNLGYLVSHADCQTLAAAIGNLGNDFVWPFYNQNVYRYPSENPIYAGVPIDPQTDPGAFEQAVNDAIEANIEAALSSSALLSMASDGNGGVTFTKSSQSFLIVVPAAMRDLLAAFADDMNAKSKNPVAFPSTDANGNPLPQFAMDLMRGSIGARMAASWIGILESQDPDVNPCIRVLDAGLVLEMLSATIGTVATLAIGPAISATALVVKIITTIQKLASLAQ